MNPSKSQLRWTGLFLLGGVVLIAVSVVFLAGSRLSRQKLSLSCEIRGESVSGLATGSKVSLRGIDVGLVEGMRFHPDDPERILVEIEVDPDAPVHRDAWATLEIFGITGLKYLEIAPGTPGSGRIAEGSVIPTRPSQTTRILNSIEEISTTSARVLANLDSLTRIDRQHQVDSILADLRTTTRDFAGISGDLRDARLGQQASKVMASVESIADRVDSTLKATQPGRSLARLDSATTAVSGVARRADRMLARSQGDLYRSLEDLSASMKNLSEFSQSIRDNPASLLRQKDKELEKEKEPVAK